MTSRKTKMYRFLEILPGALTWFTLLGAVVFSYFFPFWVAIYIIVFDVYWVLKAINTAMHLLSTFSKLKLHASYNWTDKLEKIRDMAGYRQYLSKLIATNISQKQKNDLKSELVRLEGIDFSGRDLDWRHVYHLVILPTYKESFELLDASVRSIVNSEYPLDKIFFVLATEERDRVAGLRNGAELKARYGSRFFRFETIMHPDGRAGEIKAKGANLTYAARKASSMLSEMDVPFENVIVSAFDSDTVVSRNYFAYLTYTFLTAKKPYRTSYQPMPVYNNNIWDAPAITRVVAVANSFWQMTEASRPDRLVTFSSQAITLKALVDVDFWPVDVIS
ncbi:MAG: hypothetical protein Q8R08_01980, partial [bacterium]|nr:hypothetical protein [bacterium]